jgi:predicted metal-dependent phosphoesterase TrpH
MGRTPDNTPVARFADLHLHTRYSDGSDSPAEVVRRARQIGFVAIAITDHDTLDAIPESLAAGEEFGIEVIAGVEITCRVESQEVHMLGYFFGDAWKNENLRAVLDHSRRIREKRVEQFVDKLNQVGVPLTLDDVRACSDCGTFGRPHIAQALVTRGFATSTEDAFERFLKRGRPAFVERYRMTAAEAIDHIKRAGGVAVLAHPALNKVDTRIGDMVAQGLDGIEAWHSRQSPAQSEHYVSLADQFGIVATGGSDCHGGTRGKALLGAVRLPYDRLKALKARAGQLR